MNATPRRAVKVYRLERRSCSLPSRVADALSMTHKRQGDVLVAARTIREAEGLMNERLGGHVSRGTVSVAHGNDAEALRAAGLLDEAGTVLAYEDSTRDQTVVRVTADEVEPVGAWRFVEQVGGEHPYKRIVFERLDGRRFVQAPV